MCIARSRFASSINGRFSSSVNSFHSAPVKRQTAKQFVEWDMREWTTSSMCAYVGVDETNQRWNRSWNNGETKEARNCWRSCYIEVFHESRINFKASTRLSRFNHFPFVFQFQCLSMRHEHRRHTQKVNRNSGRKKNCFNWKKKENGGWQKRGHNELGMTMGEKVFPVFSTALWAVAREGEHEREIFHYRMTMLFFTFAFLFGPLTPSPLSASNGKLEKSH